MPKGFVMRDIDKIVLLPEIQVRCEVDAATVVKYAGMVKDGVEFDPLDVYVDDQERYLLGDGWHRLLAYQSNGFQKVKVILHDQDPKNAIRNAIQRALEKNGRHGLNMTREDKRKAVSVALQHFREQSDRALGQMCGVSPGLVAHIREHGLEQKQKKKAPVVAQPEIVKPVLEAKTTTPPVAVSQQHPEPARISPLEERLRTVATWVREGSLDFPDLRELFETKAAAPMMVPRNVIVVRIIVPDREPIELPVRGLRVGKGDVVEIAATMESLTQTFSADALHSLEAA